MTISVLLYMFYTILSTFSPAFGWVQVIIGNITFQSWIYYICDHGQDLVTTWEQLQEGVYSMEWYKWNMENIKIYRTFSLNMKAEPLKLSAVLEINFELFKEIVKMFYSFGNILYSTQHRGGSIKIA
ncbi:uncharacterized protein LOC115881350 [Sitophilus oryzae]|uniref:Uncharacterized protein LOC115881350 n=1 Tax=Sitophilus oryzae TaxID=7048 RepID=A0A6J2XUE8_SITOR|nr:uncharacterized protein LOC115881350 [Sitophilus oryzae]